MTQAITHAVLLAAGRGKRLGALTADRPKPMVPVAGKPIIEHILVGLAGAGIASFTFVIGYRGDLIRDYFGDGARWGVRIDYAEQAQPNGTGAALAVARDYVPAEPILASFGDILTDFAHYHNILTDFRAASCAAIVGINRLEDVSAGGAVYRAGNRVTGVVEKPPPGTAQSNWNLAGVSIYGPVIWPVLAALKPSKRGEYEITDAIETLITAGQEVRAVEFRGYWSDVGTPEALAEAERRAEAAGW